MFLQRQQNKQQPKIEMGLTHFPPLPTSVESGSTPSQPPTLTTSHNHTSNEEGKTVADIVKGKRMKDVQTFVSFQSPSLASSNGGVSLQSPLLPAQTQTTSAIRNEKNTAKSSANQPGVVPSVNHQGPPPNTNTTSSTAALPSQQINVSTVSTPKVTANQPVMSKSTQTTQPSVGVANSGAMPTQTLVSAVVSSGQAVTSQTQPQQRQSQQQSSVKVCVCDCAYMYIRIRSFFFQSSQIPVQEVKASTNGGSHKVNILLVRMALKNVCMMVGINKSNKPYLLFQCVQSGTRYSDRENGPINRQNVSTSTTLTL